MPPAATTSAARRPERPGAAPVVEHAPRGPFPTRPLGPGECARIFTGAPLPEGADTVVRQEDTDHGAETVTICKRPRRRGEHPARGRGHPAGRDGAPGRDRARPGASSACSRRSRWRSPLVYRRPRVAILGSGDEIVDVDQPEEILSGRKIASSNTHTLLALVRRAGGEPVNLGIARDTPESLREQLRRALDCDLLVTTAGISVGEHDYVRAVLDELGAEQRFWKLRMRPGAPVGFGLLGGHSLDRPARQPGEHDGDLRAVRAAGDPEDVRATPCPSAGPCRCASPSRSRSSRSCSTSCAAMVRRRARRAGGAAHRASGLGHSHLHGAGQRAARPSGGPIRDACRGNGAGDQARRSGAPARARVLN